MLLRHSCVVLTILWEDRMYIYSVCKYLDSGDVCSNILRKICAVNTISYFFKASINPHALIWVVVVHGCLVLYSCQFKNDIHIETIIWMHKRSKHFPQSSILGPPPCLSNWREASVLLVLALLLPHFLTSLTVTYLRSTEHWEVMSWVVSVCTEYIPTYVVSSTMLSWISYWIVAMMELVLADGSVHRQTSGNLFPLPQTDAYSLVCQWIQLQPVSKNGCVNCQ